MSNNKRKTATAVVATAVTAAILLTGTYAWQSISQTATNIASDTVNPGGRLHNDFSGPGKNKDIYVENFADEQIFARIQLSEYFEIGQEAGANFGVDSRNVSIITTDEEGNASNPEDKSTWSIHKFDDTDNTADYWTWATGGSTIFMPTFNKNKDSLEADINGTYESIDGEGNRYSDYVEYEDGETVTENAIYDADTNDTDEIAEENAQIDVNYKEVSEEHIAKATATAELKSMQEWIDEGKPVGDYWVYDTDGWVYYAKPIEAGEATGLLLDGIELTGVVDNNWYYAINVIAQFVTANDLGSAEDATGFYDLEQGTEPTQEALDLLETIGVNTLGEVDPNESPISFGMIIDGSTPYYTKDVIQYFNTNISEKTYDFEVKLEIGNSETNYDSVTYTFEENEDYTLEEGTDENAGYIVAVATAEAPSIYNTTEGTPLARINPTTGEVNLLLDPEPPSQEYNIQATVTCGEETYTSSIPFFIRSMDVILELYSSTGQYDGAYLEGTESSIVIDPELKILNIVQDDTKVVNWKVVNEGDGSEILTTTVTPQDDGTAIVNISADESTDTIIIRAEYTHDGTTDGLYSDTYPAEFRIYKVEPTEEVIVNPFFMKQYYELGDTIRMMLDVKYSDYNTVPEEYYEVEYSITDGEGNPLTTDTKIENGMLVVADDETATNLILTATVTVTGDKGDRTQTVFTGTATISAKE